MGERTDGLDPANDPNLDPYTAPVGALPDPGVPAYQAGDVERDETDETEVESPEIAKARADIEETRAEMGETIDALKDRLSPQSLMEDAKESVREATIGRAETAVHNAADSAREIWNQAEISAKGAGNRMLESIKDNPVPAALIGIGAGWLLMNARQHEGGVHTESRRSDYGRADYGRADYGYRGGATGTYGAGTYGTAGTYGAPGAYSGSPSGSIGGTMEEARERIGEVGDRAQQMAGEVQERAGEAMSQVRQTAGQVGETAREKAIQAREGFSDMLHENPVGMGLAALALGVAVGFALPETRQENRWMGETRDTVMERAGQTVQEVAQKVETVAREAVSTATETVQQEAKNQGLTPQ